MATRILLFRRPARISLDMVRAPQSVQVKELLVVDGGQSADSDT